MLKKGFIFMTMSFMIGASALLAGCAKPEQPVKEAPVEAAVSPEQLQARQAAVERPSPTEAPKLSPPKLDDVREAVKRVYQNVVVIDTTYNPSFVVGDFNADGSQDLAVIVKPANADSAILEINNEMANWIITEPKKVLVPKALADVRAMQKKTKPLPVRKGEELMAVIHGVGPNGWRNPDARQTYLLRDVAGIGMKSESAKELGRAGKAKDDLPAFNAQVLNNGDVIIETLSGERGLVFWTGADYSWYRRITK